MSARRAWARSLGARIGPWLLRAGGRWTRIRVLHPEHEQNALDAHQAVIYVLWHGRLWLPISQLRHRHPAVLVSLSPDGEMIARSLERLGYGAVRGSSSRRGSEGLRELEELLGAGRSVAMTPDGPRGPRHVAQMGAVALAARTGKPLLPLSSASRPAWRFGSWDAFQMSRPGSRGVLAFGSPLLVPAGEDDLEPWRRQLEAALIAVEHEADREVGASS